MRAGHSQGGAWQEVGLGVDDDVIGSTNRSTYFFTTMVFIMDCHLERSSCDSFAITVSVKLSSSEVGGSLRAADE